MVPVKDRSMEPVLREGDRLLCTRQAELWQGAIVVRNVSPGQFVPKYVIRRLVAMAGEKRGGVLIPPGLCWLEGDTAADGDSRAQRLARRTEIAAVGVARLRANRLTDLAPEFIRPPAIRALVGELLQDWRRGVKTRGFTASASFGFSPAVVHSYEGTPWELIRAAFDALEVDESDVLLDYGCGKGRVLFEARRYPFRRIIGVDIVPELVEVARSNLREDSRCHIEHADAADYAIPDDVTIIYLFNPFEGSSLEVVGGRIAESMRRRARPMRVLLYRTPGPTWLDAAAARVIAPELLLYEFVP